MEIGAYRIERELGRGGFGVVYIGVDTRLGRRAAIKQLLPELSGHREIVERFFNEAKAAANINHPGIVEIYDVGWHTDGSAYFAMKLLDGDSLAKRLRAGGPLPIGLACTLARQVASALVAAHGRGIIHRDLKPDNIILVRDDEIAIGERAVVLDFGIAKLGGPAATSQTRSGVMMGTPNYMSPEQCKGAGEVDHRTDLYALGCILFEMLTGRVPLVGEGPGEVMGMHQFVEPPLLRSLRPDAPEPLESLVSQLLAKKLDQRIQQMTAVHAALQPFASSVSREHPIAFGPATAAVAPVDVYSPTAISEGDHDGLRRARAPLVPAPAGGAPSPAPTAPDAISAAAEAANKPPLSEAPAKTTLSSAQAELASPPHKKPRMLLFGLAAAAIAAAIVIAVLARGGTDKEIAGSGDGTASGSATIDAGADESTRQSWLRECDAITKNQRWAELLECARRLDGLGDNLGQRYREHANRELAAERGLSDMKSAVQAKDFRRAKQLLATIPGDSVYRADADKLALQLEGQQRDVAEWVVECRQLAADEKWAELSECAIGLGKAGDAAGAKQLGDQARLEGRAEAALRDLKQALATKTLAAAEQLLAKIPQSSVYRKRAEAALAAKRAQQVVGGTTGSAGSAAANDIVALSRFGFLSITATETTTIYIGSAKIGETPVTRLPLAPGVHKVYAIGPRNQSKLFDVTIFGGRDTDAGTIEWKTAASPPPTSNTISGYDCAPGTPIKDVGCKCPTGFTAKLAAGTAVCAASPAPSQPPQDPKERAKKLFEEGSTAYTLGQFEAAIKKFKEAFELFPEPTFLFNIAQSYRQLGDKQNAIFFYKRFLSLKPSTPNAEQVRKFIVDLGGQP